MVEDGLQIRAPEAEEILFGGGLAVVDVAHGADVVVGAAARVVQGSIPGLVLGRVEVVAGEAALLEHTVPVFQPRIEQLFGWVEEGGEKEIIENGIKRRERKKKMSFWSIMSYFK